LDEYVVHCWNCLGEYDALSAVWCSCNPTHPTKVCPFCLQCFCSATKDYKDRFFKNAPTELLADLEMFSQSRGPLGEALLGAKAITSDQLLHALKYQKTSGKKLGEALVELGYIDAETLNYFLSHQKSVMKFDLKNLEIDPMLITSIGPDYCYEKVILPVSREQLSQKEILTLAMAQPSDGETIDFVQNISGCQVVPVQSKKEEILTFLMPFISPKESSPSDAPPAETTHHGISVLRKALAKHASDLYIEPTEYEITIHMRIDGILYKTTPIPKELQGIVIHELKLLLKLDPFATDKPQESRIVMKSGDVRYDVIAHSLPTRYGENLSLRIINRMTFLKGFDQLGLTIEEQLLLRSMLSAHSGLILVSAPVLHGMTTTIYSIMNEVSSQGQRKTVSVEYQSVCPVPDVTQVSLGEDKSEETAITALKGLSTIQPDVCIFGDPLETPLLAKEASKFSQSMLVIAGIDARNSYEALDKLLAFGIPQIDIARQLLLVINQRLIRTICPDCVQEGSLSERALYLMGLTPNEAKTVDKVNQGQGCENCSQLGYKGRMAIFEFLAPSIDFKKMFAKNPKDKGLEKEALKSGMVTLRSKTIEEIRKGRTTLEEFQKGNF
jgi:type IV pilus assembly protein PilB